MIIRAENRVLRVLISCSNATRTVFFPEDARRERYCFAISAVGNRVYNNKKMKNNNNQRSLRFFAAHPSRGGGLGRVFDGWSDVDVTTLLLYYVILFSIKIQYLRRVKYSQKTFRSTRIILWNLSVFLSYLFVFTFDLIRINNNKQKNIIKSIIVSTLYDNTRFTRLLI